MRKLLLITLFLSFLSSCAPVIGKGIRQTAIYDFSLSEIRASPDIYKGRTFILGGLIADTKLTESGSIIEAVYMHTDSWGYRKRSKVENVRYRALLPKEKGILDPLIYSPGREITVAGEFIDMQTGKIGEMEYRFPVFEIGEIYLWEEEKEDRYKYPPPYYYPYPYWYDPWMRRPYPPPWW